MFSWDYKPLKTGKSVQIVSGNPPVEILILIVNYKSDCGNN